MLYLTVIAVATLPSLMIWCALFAIRYGCPRTRARRFRGADAGPTYFA